MQNFLELAGRRQSCRAFSDKPVEKEALLSLAEAARLSPSACNSQPWSLTAVTGEKARAQVAACVQMFGLNRFAEGCPAFLVVAEEKAKLIPRLAETVPSQHFAALDIGLAAAHICLQAADIGLGTCILGMFDEDRLREALDIPADKAIRLVIAVGYPADETVRPKVRRALPDIVRFAEE